MIGVNQPPLTVLPETHVDMVFRHLTPQISGVK